MSPRQLFLVAACVLTGLTVAIAAGTFIGLVLKEAIERGPWAVALWAVLVAAGALAGVRLQDRIEESMKRLKR